MPAGSERSLELIRHKAAEHGLTAVHAAVERGHLEVVQFLVKSGVDVNHAARTHFHDMVSASKRPLTEAKESGATPLFLAAYKGQAGTEAVLALLQRV